MNNKTQFFFLNFQLSNSLDICKSKKKKSKKTRAKFSLTEFYYFKRCYLVEKNTFITFIIYIFLPLFYYKYYLLLIYLFLKTMKKFLFYLYIFDIIMTKFCYLFYYYYIKVKERKEEDVISLLITSKYLDG